MKRLICFAFVLFATRVQAASDCGALSDQGERQLEQGQLDPAKVSLEQAVRLCRAPPQVRGARPYVALGTIYFREKRYRDAIRQFEDALQLQPDLPRAYINLSAVYSEMGDQEKSIEYGKKGLNSGVGDEAFQANFNVGLSYVRLAAAKQDFNDRRARPYFEKAAELKPSFGGSFFYLGVLKESMDRDSFAAHELYVKSCQLDYAQGCDGAKRLAGAKPHLVGAGPPPASSSAPAQSPTVPYEPPTPEEQDLYEQIRAAYRKKGMTAENTDTVVKNIRNGYSQVKPEYRLPALKQILKSLQ